jgi:hypothetical protein
MKSLSCPNGQCSLSGKAAAGRIIRYGFYKTRWGKRIVAAQGIVCLSVQYRSHVWSELLIAEMRKGGID